MFKLSIAKSIYKDLVASGDGPLNFVSVVNLSQYQHASRLLYPSLFSLIIVWGGGGWWVRIKKSLKNRNKWTRKIIIIINVYKLTHG